MSHKKQFYKAYLDYTPDHVARTRHLINVVLCRSVTLWALRHTGRNLAFIGHAPGNAKNSGPCLSVTTAVMLTKRCLSHSRAKTATRNASTMYFIHISMLSISRIISTFTVTTLLVWSATVLIYLIPYAPTRLHYNVSHNERAALHNNFVVLIIHGHYRSSQCEHHFRFISDHLLLQLINLSYGKRVICCMAVAAAAY